MTQDNVHPIKHATSDHPISKSTRILLVEDNRINQAVIAGVLSSIGLSADVAENGVEALSVLNSVPNASPYRLIIMDCQMPEMDGYETTQAIRAGKAKDIHCNVPILAMTANTMKGDREKCLAAGMSDYATKPLDAVVLHEKIAFWLGIDSKTLLKVEPAPAKVAESNSNTNVNNEKINSLALNKSITWDKEGFLKRIRRNDILAKKLITMFIDDVPALKYELIEAIDNCFFDDVLVLAHKVTGSSKNLGGVTLARLTQQIEQSAKKQDKNELFSLQKDLVKEFDLLVQTLQQFLLPIVNSEQQKVRTNCE